MVNTSKSNVNDDNFAMLVNGVVDTYVGLMRISLRQAKLFVGLKHAQVGLISDL